MKTLLIIISCGLAGASYALRRNAGGKVCAGLLVLAVLLVAIFPSGESSSRYTQDIEVALGEVFGAEIIKAFPGSANVLVLFPKGSGNITTLYKQSNLQGLQNVLLDAGKYELLVSENPDLPSESSFVRLSIPAVEDMVEEAGAPVDVVVSFVGLPDGPPYQWSKNALFIVKTDRISDPDRDWVKAGTCLLVAGVANNIEPGTKPKGSSALQVMSHRYDTFPPRTAE